MRIHHPVKGEHAGESSRPGQFHEILDRQQATRHNPRHNSLVRIRSHQVIQLCSRPLLKGNTEISKLIGERTSTPTTSHRIFVNRCEKNLLDTPWSVLHDLFDAVAPHHKVTALLGSAFRVVCRLSAGFWTRTLLAGRRVKSARMGTTGRTSRHTPKRYKGGGIKYSARGNYSASSTTPSRHYFTAVPTFTLGML
jgi:hypothetical protein